MYIHIRTTDMSPTAVSIRFIDSRTARQLPWQNGKGSPWSWPSRRRALVWTILTGVLAAHGWTALVIYCCSGAGLMCASTGTTLISFNAGHGLLLEDEAGPGG